MNPQQDNKGALDSEDPTLSLGTTLSDEEVRAAVEVLRKIHDERSLLYKIPDELGNQLLKLAGQVSRPGPKAKRSLAREVRKQRRAAIREADNAALEQTGIRRKRAAPVYETPTFPVDMSTDDLDEKREAPRVLRERNCYICKKDFTELHSFYDSMCIPCGDRNYAKRTPQGDLSGYTALVTGARVKIGYQAAIMLLRAGAKVIVTTRFPRDAARRYAAESDANQWKDRLEIHGLDLRHTPSVETFCQRLLHTQERLDFIINNACQTVRRPPGFYEHLMAGERCAISQAELPLAAHQFLQHGESGGELVASSDVSATSARNAAELSQLVLLREDLDRSEALFPVGKLDQDLQQVDLRSVNSWRLPLEEVSAVELLEVQLVNAVAPFVLNGRLKSLMLRADSKGAGQRGVAKQIVNVSAMEGQFYRSFKTDKHPHTNMAKAALNMMTRTSASGYAKEGIYMNSVDTGWVSDEDPAQIAARKKRDHGFHPPLDIVDGAARIVDPIFASQGAEEPAFGQFFKDFAPTAW